METQPYLFFEGRCEEAAAYYHDALGAEISMLMRYKESPEPPPPGIVPPGSENKIMHCTLRIGDTTIMASDGLCSGQPSFKGFSLSLNLADETLAERYFDALADGGNVDMPMEKTFWAPRFGMVSDRFGVQWMINVTE
jgi:PhnB protein